MKYVAIFQVAVILFVAMPLSSALAEQSATVFPPLNNSSCLNSGAKFLSWITGDAGTRCSTGQEVLANALSNCTEGQVVAFSGGRFVCKTVTANNTQANTWQDVPFDSSPFQLNCTYQVNYINPYVNNEAETQTVQFVYADQICVTSTDGPAYTCVPASNKGQWFHSLDGSTTYDHGYGFTNTSIKKLCN